MKPYKVLEFSDSSIVVQINKNGNWDTDFSISPLEHEICSICGHPLKIRKKCNFHKELYNLKIPFSLCYAGYYQTDVHLRPMNDFTKKINIFRQESKNSILIDQFLEILDYRWRRQKDKDDYHWIMAVPSLNSNLNRLTKEFAILHNLKYINWTEVFNLIHIDSIKFKKKNSEKKEIIFKKYTIKKDILSSIKTIFKKSGIVLDDILNTGMTIAHIIQLITIIENPEKIKGLVLGRSRSKIPLFVFFPKKKSKL